jgi:hypothetical protein
VATVENDDADAAKEAKEGNDADAAKEAKEGNDADAAKETKEGHDGDANNEDAAPKEQTGSQSVLRRPPTTKEPSLAELHARTAALLKETSDNRQTRKRSFAVQQYTAALKAKEAEKAKQAFASAALMAARWK